MRGIQVKKRWIIPPIIIFIIAGAAAILIMYRQEPKLSPDSAYGIPIQTRLLPQNSAKRPGSRRRIRYIVIHDTGNPAQTATARAHSVYLLTPNDESTSWHYTVDDAEIYRHIPDDEIAWHASSTEGNRHGIGIELCVNSGGDFEKTFDNAARLTACLLKLHRLTIADIRQHADFTNKNCPASIRDQDRMTEFIALVTFYLNAEEPGGN